MEKFKTISALLLALMLLTSPAVAKPVVQEYTGKVIGISDGDTLTVLKNDKTQIKVRLAEIDAPEKEQGYGTKSKQILSGLVFNKDVKVRQLDKDRYGRAVAKIFIGDVDINYALVSMGAVWVYDQYVQDPAIYRLQESAQSLKKGLWALPEAERMAPWEFRQAQRGMHQTSKPANDNIQLKSSNSEDQLSARSSYKTSCCLQCTKGKPCGDGCIGAGQTCRKQKGCAC